ncbi:MAG TPA: hypothetical protein VIQ80_03430 [Candidatus Saccharimonadales bacterium]
MSGERFERVRLSVPGLQSMDELDIVIVNDLAAALKATSKRMAVLI